MDGVVDLHRIARKIVRTRADIVVLSELDVNRERTGLKNQPRELQQLGDYPYLVFHPSVSDGDSHYGNIILSKYPVVNDYGCELPNVRGAEKRKVIAAEVEIGSQQVVVFGTHLSVESEERPAQVEKILQVAEKAGGPFVLCGDLNCTPDSPEVKALVSGGFVDTYPVFHAKPGYTFPADNPAARIDYIFVDDTLRRGLVNADVMATQAADHYGIVTTLEISQR